MKTIGPLVGICALLFFIVGKEWQLTKAREREKVLMQQLDQSLKNFDDMLKAFSDMRDTSDKFAGGWTNLQNSVIKHMKEQH